MSNRAWVTLATNDSYGLGALVLAHSLRRASSAYPAVVLITPSVTEPMRERLRAVFAEVVIVDVLDSRDAAHLALLQRPELGITFTKIHCWNLTQYEKCVFLDADTLVVQNCDELFEREELSAAPDVGWPDCFNSGVFVFRPSGETFSNLVKFASERGSFDGGDQGLLNSFFSDWAHGDINKHLPFLYNVTSAAFYSYLPALKHYGQNLKIIHFIGAVKPWLQQYNWQSRSVQAPEHLREFLQLWWDLFVEQVHVQLDVNMDEGYIEEQESTMFQPEPIEYTEPVTQHFGYYEPSLDSESEFPWHHPESQVSDTEVNRPQIDMSQFFDPWNIYRGNIPPNTEDSEQAEQKDDHDYENMRKYAWDYVPPQHSQYQSKEIHNYEHITQSQPQHHTNTSEHIPQQHYHEIQHDSHSTQHYHSPPQEHTWQCSNESSQNVYQHSEYTPSVPQSNEYHYKEDSHSQSHEFSHYDQQHNHYHQHQYNDNHHHQPVQHSYSQSEYSTYREHEPSNPQEHYFDNRHFEEENYDNSSHNDHSSHNETATNNQVPHLSDTEQNQTIQTIKKHNHINDFTYLQLKNPNREEQIYTVMMDHVRMRNESVKVNGYASDSDSDIYDEIRPRHPYDGFYLRHRMTIDSRGRKICSHEIPYIPRSPSPTSTEDYEDALEYTPDDSTLDDEDVQTGVAGNLARVVPGAPLQREAVDELSRRQGWEAGNIDYMGADSFDNIWAKISQTLSQPPASPEQASEPQGQEEAKPDSSESAPAEAPKEAEPVIEEESVPEAPAEKVAEVPVEAQEAPAEVPKSESEKPEPVVESEPAVVPAPVEVPSPSEDIEVPVPASEAAEAKLEEPIPVPADATAVEASAEPAPAEEQSEPVQEIPVAAVEALKIDEAAPAESAPASEPAPAAAPAAESVPAAAAAPAAETVPVPEPAPVAEAVPAPVALEVIESKPEEPAKVEVASDSPPLANTPSKEEIPGAPAAKSAERRKLQLPPPVADPLPTPDSELEDAAALAHAIIASELRTPPPQTSISPATPSTPSTPASPVSLSQIGVKPKPTIAAQIESSVPKEPKPKAEGEAPKKKIVKKIVKKEASGESPAPVPPPRKKEKKPKEK